MQIASHILNRPPSKLWKEGAKLDLLTGWESKSDEEFMGSK
jgi:hypothetical protein